MRLAVLLVSLGVCTTAWAAPVLKFDSESPIRELVVRLVAPDGTITWSCQQQSPDDPLVSPPMCVAPPTWYRGPGKYVIIARSLTGAGFFVTKDLVVAGDEPVIKLRARYGGLTQLIPSGARLRLRVEQGSLRNASFTNYGGTPVWGTFNPAMVSLEHFEKGEWRPTRFDSHYVGHDRVEPEETLPVTLPSRAFGELEPGRYRAVMTVTTEDPNGSRPDERSMTQLLEVASDSFDYQPGKWMEVCYEEEKPWALYRGEGPFRSLHTTSLGVLLLKSSGELIRVDEGSMRVIATLPADSALQTGPSEDALLVIGPQLMHSSDGGRTFAPIGQVSANPGEQYVFAGEGLFRFNNTGEVARINWSGKVTELKLPVKANWRTAAFRDELHGALIGDCSVLLETDDGGSTWKAGPTPWPFPHIVLWSGNDLTISASPGRWIRKQGTTTWVKTEKPISFPGRSFRYDITSKSDPIAGKDSLDVHVIRRGAHGKENAFAIHLDDPPFRGPVGLALASDGAVFFLTTPAGLFRYSNGKLTELLSSEELVKYPDTRRALRERLRAVEERRGRKTTTSP